MDQADGDRSSGKWGLVVRLLQLGCTQGRWSYEEVLKAKRARGSLGEEGLKGHRWALPATEEEWAELEGEWERRIVDAKLDGTRTQAESAAGHRDMAKVLLGTGRPAEHAIIARVKEWQQELTTAHPLPPTSTPLSSPFPTTRKSATPAPLAKLVSVENISHEGASVAQPRPRRKSRSTSRTRPTDLPAKPAEKTRGKTGTAKKAKVQPVVQLGFPVVKRASQTSVGSKPSQDRKEIDKGKVNDIGKEKEKEVLSNEKQPVHSIREEADDEDEREVDESMRLESTDVGGQEKLSVSALALATPQIQDVSEMVGAFPFQLTI